jgi:AAA domain
MNLMDKARKRAKEDGAKKECGTNDGTDSGVVRLATTRLDEIKPVPIRWLVPGYIPLGKLVLLAGDGGHGKSALTLQMTACITRGLPCFGLEYDAGLPADVLLISCEDDYGDTVVPRLLSAGADLTRVLRVDGIRGKTGETTPFSMAYYEAMERELEARPGVRLVVIDPAGAYIGRAGIDDHKDSELRALLGPLSEVAARRRTTIIIVKHLVKGATTKAVHKVGGSAGYINTVRAAFIVCPDAEDAARKFFLPVKFNLGPRPSGRSYRTQSLDDAEQTGVLDQFTHLDAEDKQALGKQLFRVEWIGEVDVDADDALSATTHKGGEPNKVERAAAWLEVFLNGFAWPSKEIVDAGKEAGFTFDNIKEAKLSLKSKGLRNSNLGRLRGEWWSGFGDPREWTLRDDQTSTHKETAPLHTKKKYSPPSPFSPLSPSPPLSSVGRVGSVVDVGSNGCDASPDSNGPEDTKAMFPEKQPRKTP